MFSGKESFKSQFRQRLAGAYGKAVEEATDGELYQILGTMVREQLGESWIATNRACRGDGVKQVYYFSLEFLLGRLLGSNLINMGILEMVDSALREMGADPERLEACEPDAGLGNGGLGRLAACFLDSLASLDLPGHGCGIRYKYGLFEQKIVDGYQVELPDNWLREGNVWEVRRADKAVEVRFGGRVTAREEQGRLTFDHYEYESVLAVPYDIPVAGYHTGTVNTLRLFSAEMMSADFDPRQVSMSDQRKIIEYKRSTEAISEFLYPDDSHWEGKRLRLKQQYFLVCAGIHSILRTYRKRNLPLSRLPEFVSIHINDTHPALAIPELMRILLDEEKMSWEEAWMVTGRTVSYTNHTTLVEAMETWPHSMMQELLPRITMIIEEIDRRFRLEVIQRYLGKQEMAERMAIVRDGTVHMAHLAVAGSHSINGVAQVHTEILKQRVLKDFCQIYPHRFNNKTNGITHRRWLLKANPRLADLVTRQLGEDWIRDPDLLQELARNRNREDLQDEFLAIRQENKEALARLIHQETGISVDTSSIFDVQVKRLHAYKRQVLNVLHILDMYCRLRENPALELPPRTFIFGAKAAPSYYFAKKVIKLIHAVADLVNRDPATRDVLRVVFLENYSVTLAEQIIPAADISEQISTASKEASGTGNMKFMLNGAVTVGTLDGANIEIRQEVGDENIFIFGLTAAEVLNYYQYGGYSALETYNSSPRVARVVDMLVGGELAGSYGEIRDIYNALLAENDEYFVLRDLGAYLDVQESAGIAFQNRREWAARCLSNVAGAGVFSSDRTIREYARDIWGIRPLPTGDRPGGNPWNG